MSRFTVAPDALGGTAAGLRDVAGGLQELAPRAGAIARGGLTGATGDALGTFASGWLRGSYSSSALRSGLKWGLPIIGIGTGSVLDYEQARADGHSVAGSLRRTVVNDVFTVGGTWGGRTACAAAVAATSESGGWGAAACPILVPAGAWLGHAGGEVANVGIDKISGAIDDITGHHDKPPVLYSGPADPSQMATPPGGGAYG